MNPDIWDILHDGGIVGATGHVPGTVRLEIDIQYLRERFPDAGSKIVLTLLECSRIDFSKYEDNLPHGLVELADISPDILGACEADGCNEVTCAVLKGSGGILRVAATDFSLSLDSGRIITLDELKYVAKAYWKSFGERER